MQRVLGITNLKSEEVKQQSSNVFLMLDFPEIQLTRVGLGWDELRYPLQALVLRPEKNQSVIRFSKQWKL